MSENERSNINSKETSDPKELTDLTDQAEEVSVYLRYAQKRLKKLYGIDDLSTSEAVVLRNIIEELIPQFKEEKRLVENNEMSRENSFEIEEEAVALWLIRQMGMNERDVQKIYLVKDYTDGKTYKFELNDEDKAREKEKDLEAEGHSAFCYETVPEEFKEYLRRQRENKKMLP